MGCNGGGDEDVVDDPAIEDEMTTDDEGEGDVIDDSMDNDLEEDAIDDVSEDPEMDTEEDAAEEEVAE